MLHLIFAYLQPTDATDMSNLFINFALAFFLLIGLSCKGPEVRKKLFENNAEDWFLGGDAVWDFKGVELRGMADGGAGFIMTRDVYTDFELLLDFFPDSTINSGVFIRCKDKEVSNTACYEINIWDLHPDQDSRTGSIVTRTTPLVYVETLNKWNHYRIRCVDNRIQVWVNGTLIADLRDSGLKAGYVALQAAEKGRIRFKNVQLLPLD